MSKVTTQHIIDYAEALLTDATNEANAYARRFAQDQKPENRERSLQLYVKAETLKRLLHFARTGKRLR